MKIFDYIFIRIFKLSISRHQGEEISRDSTLGIMSLLAFFIIFDIYILINSIILNNHFLKFPIVLSFLIISLAFHARYDKKKIHAILKNGQIEKLKKIRWLIDFTLLFICMFPVIIAVIEYNK